MFSACLTWLRNCSCIPQYQTLMLNAALLSMVSFLSLFTGVNHNPFSHSWSFRPLIRLCSIQKWFWEQSGIGTGNKYLSGILFTTSGALQVVLHLQKVIQADGCHISFGIYTIYIAYGSSADGSIFPIRFAILFGNESTVVWCWFWEFSVCHYPYLNQPNVTIITDQHKCSINAIKQHLPLACHYLACGTIGVTC